MISLPQQGTSQPPTTKQQCSSGNPEEETRGIFKTLSIKDPLWAFRCWVPVTQHRWSWGWPSYCFILISHFWFSAISLTWKWMVWDFSPVQGEWLFIARAPEVLLSHRNLITKESMPFPNSNPDKKLGWARRLTLGCVKRGSTAAQRAKLKRPTQQWFQIHASEVHGQEELNLSSVTSPVKFLRQISEIKYVFSSFLLRFRILQEHTRCKVKTERDHHSWWMLNHLQTPPRRVQAKKTFKGIYDRFFPLNNHIIQ